MSSPNKVIVVSRSNITSVITQLQKNESGSSEFPVGSNYTKQAQTFLSTGFFFNGVKLFSGINTEDGNLLIQIVGVTSGKPNNTIYASKNFPLSSLAQGDNLITFSFSSSDFMSGSNYLPSGQEFALVTTLTGHSAPCGIMMKVDTVDPYTHGELYYFNPDTEEWETSIAEWDSLMSVAPGTGKRDFYFEILRFTPNATAELSFKLVNNDTQLRISIDEYSANIHKYADINLTDL